jgi:hypothetical protein
MFTVTVYFDTPSHLSRSQRKSSMQKTSVLSALLAPYYVAQQPVLGTAGEFIATQRCGLLLFHNVL